MWPESQSIGRVSGRKRRSLGTAQMNQHEPFVWFRVSTSVIDERETIRPAGDGVVVSSAFNLHQSQVGLAPVHPIVGFGIGIIASACYRLWGGHEPHAEAFCVPIVDHLEMPQGLLVPGLVLQNRIGRFFWLMHRADEAFTLVNQVVIDEEMRPRPQLKRLARGHACRASEQERAHQRAQKYSSGATCRILIFKCPPVSAKLRS